MAGRHGFSVCTFVVSARIFHTRHSVLSPPDMYFRLGRGSFWLCVCGVITSCGPVRHCRTLVERRQKQAAEDSGRRSRGIKGVGHESVCPECGHSRKAGMSCFNHWIPALAGMTSLSRQCPGLSMCIHLGLFSLGLCRRYIMRPRRHSGEGPPTWMQVVERRLEQAAEESSRNKAFPLCGNDHKQDN